MGIMIYVVGDKHVADNRCSEVAQWWSRRLLTARSRVRAPPSEPFLSQNASELAGVAELADAQDLKSCDPYRSYRFDPGLRHQLSNEHNILIINIEKVALMTRGGAVGSSSGS